MLHCLGGVKEDDDGAYVVAGSEPFGSSYQLYKTFKRISLYPDNTNLDRCS